MSLRSIVRWVRGRNRAVACPQIRRKTVLSFEDLESRSVPAILAVGPTDSIQAAINRASAGDTIRVSGVHKEQLVIAGSKLDGLKIEAANGRAVIQAPNTMTPTGIIIDIQGAKNVSISRFTIQGPVNPTGADLYGIVVHGGGSATIEGNRIVAIAEKPLSGVQRGEAILVGATVGDPSTGSAVIINNSIEKYQKTGVTVNGAGSNARILGNRIVGVGPTAAIAQNGVQISGGAEATISGNWISGNIYSPADVVSGGIILVGAGATTVSNNTLTRNDVGINVDGITAPTTIGWNVVTGNTFAGIIVQNSTGIVVANNTVTLNGSNASDSLGGIALVNAQNIRVEGNLSALNKGFGISVDAKSTGNTIAKNRLYGNSVYDADDLSTGDGTAGTGNTWSKNLGRTSNPLDLVQPGRVSWRFFVCGFGRRHR